MKLRVDLRTCENHGQCAFTAPGLFTLDDSGELAFRRDAVDDYVSPALSETEVESAEMAADMCPMQAIRLVD
ncbi:ferredoxin [Phytohabitans suffuscus]|uniref:Ferredoxin n=1 Tax=Phytohabitans suffuscus TaxID=624315 RepID=A0A6F8YUQ1_9ACTN|nr:ferredoxin [Phytohabitans suffuscus]BCB89867.1 ferredoxin [Phytohabitans suffuscus]